MTFIPVPDVSRRLRPQNRAARGQQEWFQIRAEGPSAEIRIFDEIGTWGITAQDFIAELDAVDASTLTVHLNSPGGDVFDGIAIANALRDHPANVTVVVDALAASIASVVMLAGDTVVMNRNSQVMIHDAWGVVGGNAKDMRDMAGVLDKVSNNIASAYADRAGGKPREWRDLMLAETWFDAQEAVNAGLADRVAPVADRNAEQIAARWPQWQRPTSRPKGFAAQTTAADGEFLEDLAEHSGCLVSCTQEYLAAGVDNRSQEVTTLAEAVASAAGDFQSRATDLLVAAGVAPDAPGMGGGGDMQDKRTTAGRPRAGSAGGSGPENAPEVGRGSTSTTTPASPGTAAANLIRAGLIRKAK